MLSFAIDRPGSRQMHGRIDKLFHRFSGMSEYKLSMGLALPLWVCEY
jgi:hypothetical protein